MVKNKYYSSICNSILCILSVKKRIGLQPLLEVKDLTMTLGLFCVVSSQAFPDYLGLCRNSDLPWLKYYSPRSLANSPEYGIRGLGPPYGLCFWIYAVGKSAVSSRHMVYQSYSRTILAAAQKPGMRGRERLTCEGNIFIPGHQEISPKQKVRRSTLLMGGCSEHVLTAKIHCHMETAFSS